MKSSDLDSQALGMLVKKNTQLHVIENEHTLNDEHTAIAVIGDVLSQKILELAPNNGHRQKTVQIDYCGKINI